LSIQEIRTGLANNLATISGLRVSIDIPDNPTPPQAVIAIETVGFDNAFGQGLTQYSFTVSLIASRVSERNAQRKLDDYTSNGAQSVKLAIESDKTLGGKAYDVRVTEMTNIGTVILGEVIYLAADFAVIVYAD
jgi:hypothetical protein|tara:strand:+ start:1097 stop:1498 length:402 start_codon:yes stop_codon:yes gene_type:complete